MPGMADALILELAKLVSTFFLEAPVCGSRSNLDLWPQVNTSNHDSRASLLTTQKNRKMKKPWKALSIRERGSVLYLGMAMEISILPY